MAISVATQVGAYVIGYDNKGTQILTVQGELVGYTSQSVSVKAGSYIITYGDDGRQLSVVQI